MVAKTNQQYYEQQQIALGAGNITVIMQAHTKDPSNPMT